VRGVAADCEDRETSVLPPPSGTHESRPALIGAASSEIETRKFARKSRGSGLIFPDISEILTERTFNIKSILCYKTAY
jgi:hypothetical protein